MTSQNSSLKKVQRVLEKEGVKTEILTLPQSTATAGQAAQAVGCQIGQIAKSLIFRTKGTGEPILVIASGANRVDEEKLAQFLGRGIEKADADFVKEETGFSIGGVPPFGHKKKLKTFVDEDLLQHKEVWAAAGSPHAVFKLKPQELTKIAQGQVVQVS